MSYTNKPRVCFDIDVMTTKEFESFRQLACFDIYFFLRRFIVRGKDFIIGNIDLYKEYYEKNILVSRWDQKNISYRTGLSQSTISRHISKLEELGYIKILKTRTTKGIINIYQLGVRTQLGEEYFLEKSLNNNLMRFGNFYKSGNMVYEFEHQNEAENDTKKTVSNDEINRGCMHQLMHIG